MKGNLAEKKTTLLDLANLLEPQRTILERIDKTFSSDLFYTFNNFHIRHNNITIDFSKRQESALCIRNTVVELS